METLINFRDIGTYKTKDGRKLKSKKILRSGEVVDLSEEDIHSLVQDYDVRIIVDFRGKKEAQSAPDIMIQNATYEHIDIMKGMGHNSAGLKDLKDHSGTMDPDAMMCGLYCKIIEDEEAQAGYREFIRLIEQLEEGSLLFHCFAGKDRTGIGAAFILKLLGVSEQDIMEDYLQTNIARKEANQIILEDYKNQGFPQDKLDALGELLLVKEAYLRSAFDCIEQTYGGFDAYFEQVLEVDETRRAYIRNKYLEDEQL